MIKEKRVLPYLAVPIVVSTFMCSIIDYYTSKYNYANYKYIIYSMLVFAFLYLIVPFLKKENMKKCIVVISCLIIGTAVYLFGMVKANSIYSLIDTQKQVNAIITDTVRQSGGQYSYEGYILADKRIIKSRLYSSEEIIGNKVGLTVKFFPIEDDDIRKYFNSENIYVFANVLEQKSSSNIFLLSDISTILSNRVKLHIKNPQAEIANAMTFGKKDINLITNYNLIKAGIVHITAVSGLHVGIIATIIFLALKNRNTKTILLAVLLIWAYAFFVGLSFSVIRASLLFTVMFLARLFGRKNDTLSSLMLSATIILLINPTSIASVSFQLTYLSVLALIVFYPILCKKIHSILKIEKSSGFLKLLIDSFSATVAITIFTLPVIMGLSNGFSLTAFIINPIVIAITPVIIVVTFILSITSFFPVLLLLNQILAFIIESLTSFIIFLSESISIFIGLNNLLPFTIIAVIIILIVYFIKYKWVYNAVFICVSCILLLSIIPIRDTNVYSFIGFDGYSAVLIEDGKVNIVTKNCDMLSDVNKLLDGLNINHIDNLIILGNSQKEDYRLICNSKRIYQIYDNQKDIDTPDFKILDDGVILYTQEQSIGIETKNASCDMLLSLEESPFEHRKTLLKLYDKDRYKLIRIK